MNNKVTSSKSMYLYPHISQWLSRVLTDRFPRAEIVVSDTHTVPLSSYIRGKTLFNYFNGNIYQYYKIWVDVTGFIIYRGNVELVFVDCIEKPISIVHISKLLGDSRVARPLASLLISTNGIGDAVSGLLKLYNRTDILEYHWEKGKTPRTIVIGTWNSRTKSIEPASILPPGHPII